MNGNTMFDLKDLARSRSNGKSIGIYSVCSAHPLVLEAAMRRAIREDGPLLIEATCNQVNQFGGYTGMTPNAFREYVTSIAARVNFPAHRLLLGGDHLGPHPWRHLPSVEAMRNASELVADFVLAGFTKLHLDTSMACSDDPLPLSDAVIAERAAGLAKVAEATAEHSQLRYVIGTEVPPPGGSVDELSVVVTKPEASEEALALHQQAFKSAGIEHAWERVVALVVQPGVEFGHEDVVNYEPQKARDLCAVLQKYPTLIFEAHSTDYQRPEAYKQLVSSGFAILKVGPALTYAMRQALFALEEIERNVFAEANCSRLSEVVVQTMTAHTDHWKQHYQGDMTTLKRLMIHSYSDRIRYCWNLPEIESSVARLIKNLESSRISETLISAYMPSQYQQVREGAIENAPTALILDKIADALEPYIAACNIEPAA